MNLAFRAMNKTLRIGFPPDYVHKHGLQGGDILVWVEDEDGNIKGKIVKKKKLEEMAVGQQTVA
jgi:hypothetical protein